ncbi:hypothetical protein [Parasitella parasitica]|uniref:Uncharacterized protein n=1 Tax=Parasitella parasitica TaxID=35722 RepID=A0A0B7NQ12_9FUNG|nr:hypothetical protein [Parasitella parasitica]
MPHSDRAVHAVDKAIIETVIYNAETQAYAFDEARKRRRRNEDDRENDQLPIKEYANCIVDESDEIRVVGTSVVVDADNAPIWVKLIP